MLEEENPEPQPLLRLLKKPCCGVFEWLSVKKRWVRDGGKEAFGKKCLLLFFFFLQSA